jgi:tetratricopeptide (TPR) repeat protein
MSRRYDSALGEDAHERTPGAASSSSFSSSAAGLHELESDGEDEAAPPGGDEVDIHEEDVDDSIQSSSAGAALPSTSQVPALQTLPSYQALMSSLGSSRDSSSSSSARQLSPASSTASLSLSPGAPDVDSDENHGFLEDDASVSSQHAHGSEDEDDQGDAKYGVSRVGKGVLQQQQQKIYSFEEMFDRARRLQTKGYFRKSAHYYLYCLEHYRYSHQHQDLIALCLRNLGDICYKNKKYKEALQFRTAERMVYESNLIRIVKTDAQAELEALKTAAANANASVTSDGDSSFASSSAATSPSHARNLSIMRMQSADPAPIVRTPITPKSLVADEERALTYERLAKVFYDEKNIAMAKSYALKAIELRRRIRAKWGDSTKMRPDELLLHQLSVMGKEQYEETLRRFQDGGVGGEDGEEKGDTQARTEALRRSMAQSLQALAGGSMNTGPPAPVAAAASSSSTAAASSSAQAASSPESTLRQRPSAASSAAAAAGKKSVAFDESTAGAAASADDSVSSVVREPSVPASFHRRALLFALVVALVFALLAAFLVTVTFRDAFWKVRPATPANSRWTPPR